MQAQSPNYVQPRECYIAYVRPEGVPKLSYIIDGDSKNRSHRIPRVLALPITYLRGSTISSVLDSPDPELFLSTNATWTDVDINSHESSVFCSTLSFTVLDIVKVDRCLIGKPAIFLFKKKKKSYDTHVARHPIRTLSTNRSIGKKDREIDDKVMNGDFPLWRNFISALPG